MESQKDRFWGRSWGSVGEKKARNMGGSTGELIRVDQVHADPGRSICCWSFAFMCLPCDLEPEAVFFSYKIGIIILRRNGIPSFRHQNIGEQH